MTGVSIVLSTAPVAEAEGVADRLLEQRLVACVNLIGPVRSRYRWQGEVEEAAEMVLVMKTAAATLPRLRDRFADLHPYDVPEFLELSTDGGLAAYLAWVHAETTG